MAILKGSITTKSSEEELAYSEDPSVVAGERRAGCGWVPVPELEKVGGDADVVVVRTLDSDERTTYRDIYARRGPASANFYVVRTALKEVRVTEEGKTQRLKGAKSVEWVKAVARQNPAALDLLADRVLARTDGRDVETEYATNRKLFGVAEPDRQEGKRDDEATKSAEPG